MFSYVTIYNVIVVTTEDVFLYIEVKCINLVHFEVKIKRFMDTAGKSCSTYAEPVRSAVTSSTKAAFCLFNVVGAEGTGQSFSPVNVCESLNLPY